MKMNKRGEAGFMEAIIAMMVVTIALTCFMGLLSYNNADDARNDSFSTDFLDDFSVMNGRIAGDPEDELCDIMDSKGYERVDLRITVDSVISDSYEFTVGEGEYDNVGSVTGTLHLRSDDGRSFVASYEVVFWWI